MGPDTALGNSLGSKTSWLYVKALTTQVVMVLVAAWPPDTTNISGFVPNPGLLCDLWWLCGTRTSEQTPALVGSWVLNSSRVCMSPLLKMAQGPVAVWL